MLICTPAASNLSVDRCTGELRALVGSKIFGPPHPHSVFECVEAARGIHQVRQTIDQPNQMWVVDITYIPMVVGFLYVVVAMDWYSRYVRARRETMVCL
jgi:transposase InsO family protein